MLTLKKRELVNVSEKLDFKFKKFPFIDTLCCNKIQDKDI